MQCLGALGERLLSQEEMFVSMLLKSTGNSVPNNYEDPEYYQENPEVFGDKLEKAEEALRCPGWSHVI